MATDYTDEHRIKSVVIREISGKNVLRKLPRMALIVTKN